jgi:hypothetical protein
MYLERKKIPGFVDNNYIFCMDDGTNVMLISKITSQKAILKLMAGKLKKPTYRQVSKEGVSP